MLKIAFYKATKPGLPGLSNRLIRWWTGSIYSHCEAVFDDDLSVPVLCASSSFLDGGVRFKMIQLNPDHWDVLEVPVIDKDRVNAWFDRHNGQKYDVIGLLSVFTPIRDSKSRWFCSEAVATAAGFQEAQKEDPGRLYNVCVFAGGVRVDIPVL